MENIVGSSILPTEACKMKNEDYEAAILQVQHMYLMFVGNLIADKMFLNSVQKTKFFLTKCDTKKCKWICKSCHVTN